MRDYLEQILHRQVYLKEYPAADALPLIYRDAVRLYVLQVDEQECVLIAPKAAMTLTDLRKCYRQVARVTNSWCALYLKSLTYYAKDALLKEGIPFVWENRLLYLPFMGMMLNPQDDRRLKPCGQISFSTQKLLLKALYESWQGVTVSQAAGKLQVSKMTITRCFDELEMLELPLLQVKSRARMLYADSGKRAMWETIRPILRNPIIRTFRLAERIDAGLPLSGISALAAYSMLSDDDFPTFAVEKKQLKALNASRWKQVPASEEPRCIVHEIGYRLPFGAANAIDPLSVMLMLTDEEMADPRVEMSAREMLEEYVW